MRILKDEQITVCNVQFTYQHVWISFFVSASFVGSIKIANGCMCSDVTTGAYKVYHVLRILKATHISRNIFH